MGHGSSNGGFRRRALALVMCLLVLFVGLVALPGLGSSPGEDEVQTPSLYPEEMLSLFPGGIFYPGNTQYEFNFGTGIGFGDLYFEAIGLESLLGEDAIKVYDVIEGDFNEDGRTDLVVDVGKRRAGVCEKGERIHELYVLLNEGEGEFTLAPGSPIFWGCILSHQPSLTFPGVADLNGDGHLDVIGVDTDANVLILLFGKGDGSLELVRQEVPLELVPEEPYFGGVSVGDFNEDGCPDLLIHRQYGLIPMVNDGKGGFIRHGKTIVLSEPWPGYNVVAPIGPASVGAVADFDRDGHLDVAVPHVVAEYFATWYSILYGNGRGDFEVVSSPGFIVQGTLSFEAADLNEDGWIDLLGLPLIACSYVLYNQGQRSFRIQPLGPGCWGGPIWEEGDGEDLLGDFNGDGYLDIAFFYAGNRDYAPLWFHMPYYMYVLEGNGQGYFRLVWAGEIPRLYSVPCLVADFDGDGLDDLVLGGQGISGEKQELTVFLSRVKEE